MDYYVEFNNALESRNINKCIEITRTMINEGYQVKDVYSEIIEESFKNIGKPLYDEVYDIAREHISSAILRTVIENLYTLIESKNTKGKVLVCGLEDEAHNIGARVAADYFRIASFETIFLDVNIPIDEIVKCAKELDVQYIAISITNFLNLPNLAKLVECIKLENTKTKIIVGGLAVSNNLDFINTLDVDYVLSEAKQILEVS